MTSFSPDPDKSLPPAFLQSSNSVVYYFKGPAPEFTADHAITRYVVQNARAMRWSSLSGCLKVVLNYDPHNKQAPEKYILASSGELALNGKINSIAFINDARNGIKATQLSVEFM